MLEQRRVCAEKENKHPKKNGLYTDRHPRCKSKIIDFSWLYYRRRDGRGRPITTIGPISYRDWEPRTSLFLGGEIDCSWDHPCSRDHKTPTCWVGIEFAKTQ